MENVETNPSIELRFDEITSMQPTPSEPYVWLVTKGDCPGCALDCDFYTPEEAPAKFREFLEDAGFSLTRTVYEAVALKFCGIEGDDAVDAITMAILRYFETDGFEVMNTFYDAPWDVDFSIQRVGTPAPDRFTLHPDGSVSFPDESVEE